VKLFSTTILAGAMLASTTIPAIAFGYDPKMPQDEVKAALTQIVDEFCANRANAGICRSGPVHYWNPIDRSWTVGFGAQGVYDMIAVAFGGGPGAGRDGGPGRDPIGAAIGNAGRAIGGWLGSNPFGCNGCALGSPVGSLPAGYGGPALGSPGNDSPVGTGGGPGNPPGTGPGNNGAGTEDGGSPNPGADY
jgi:hypothetical protein